MTHTVMIAGEPLELRADATLFWPRRRTLGLADPHFGKADAFRDTGVPVPGDSAASLRRLDTALRDTSAERLIILGDFWHARAGCTAAVLDELNTWKMNRGQLHTVLLRGNHDCAGPPPEAFGEAWHAGDFVDDPFCFRHHPADSEKGYTLAGHLHPGVTLYGRGRQRLRLPCFWFGPRGGVLPAFGAFTGLSTMARSANDRVFALVGEEIVALPANTCGTTLNE